MPYTNSYRKTAIFLAATAILTQFAPPLAAQTAKLAISTASIVIDPGGSDSYTIAGSFSGLDWTEARVAWLSVGNFAAGFPMSSFTRQAGTKVLTYRDSTGLAPGWISSLTIDPDAQTFQAQASGTVLAGLTNPFPVQLGTDQATSCTVVRVVQATPGTYKLTPGDRTGMTCEIASMPVATPKVVAAGTATNVTVDLSAQQFSASDVPQNIQLFRADDNAQPVGPALCSLTLQSGSDYSCTVSINQGSPGAIPMLLQATVAGQTVLSPGFAVQAVEQATSSDLQQLAAIQTAMTQAWQNFTQYGDTAYARLQTLKALRTLLAPPVELTAQPFGLSLDGLSIYARSNAGLPVVLPLDDVADILGTAGDGQPARGLGPPRPPLGRNPLIAGGRSVAPKGASPAPRAQSQKLSCGSFQRDIVWNNQVLFWVPGSLFGFNEYNHLLSIFQNAGCPSFSDQIDIVSGSQATVASLGNFGNYGTIVIDSHGGFDDQSIFLLTGETSASAVPTPAGVYGVQGIACVPQGCFKTVYPNNPNIHSLNNTIIYGGFCFSINGRSGFRNAFAPPNSQTTFFGYWGLSQSMDDIIYGVPLFQNLVNEYMSTGDAYDGAEATAEQVLDSVGMSLFGGDPSRDVCLAGKCNLNNPLLYPSANVFHFQIWNDQNVAYVGNPHMTMTPLNPPETGAQGLAAYLEGAASCGTGDAPYLYVQWTNTARAGHLTPLTGGVMGGQDNFYDQATEQPPQSTPGTLVSDWALAKYTAFPSATTSDNIVANFFPDLQNPPAAQACMSVAGNAGLFVESQIATDYDAQSPNFVATTISPPAKVTSTYTVPLSDTGGYSQLGASASVTVTPNGTNSWTVMLSVGGASPGGGAGPYDGYANIDLSAVNPGSAGQAYVQIKGMFDTATNAELSQCANSPTCSFPDGVVLINSGANGNIQLATPGTLPFTAKVDSSTSPVDIYVGMNANGESSTPAAFTIILNIQFLNQ